jgi:starch phosphorylase
VQAGQRDLERAADALASRLPPSLGVLARLAYNYRWSWAPDGPELFRAVDPPRWERCAENPVRLLQEASAEGIARAAADDELLARAAALEDAVAADLARAPVDGPLTPEAPAAYLCAEYGVHRSLPIYSGGLGVLAGDVLKAASDLALPMVAVGVLYRQGYFRQRIDASGWQQEYWVDTDPDRLPAALVTGADGQPLTVSAPVGGHEVTVQIWRVAVGRVPLFLLDAERPENDRASCWLTSRLYVAEPEVRLGQYALLGVGGVRALEALGIEPALLHLNEGHAALATLELARHETATTGERFPGALERARMRTVFTTHTPVPAGNDVYLPVQVDGVLSAYAATLGLDVDALLRLGRSRPDERSEPLGVTQLALRTSRAANGVSRRHGEVARAMWHGLWPERAVEEVPITHVTNGVHVPTWLGAPMRRLLDRHLGSGWTQRLDDPELRAGLESVPDAELWAARQEQRAELVEHVHRRSAADRLSRGEARDYALAAGGFDAGTLTLGFARRLATYKRLHLVFLDARRGLELLAGARALQVVLAGKAHPRDTPAKHVLQSLFSVKRAPELGGRVVYLDDYDMGMAAKLVRGCDVWVNLPRPPLEASGTSGMKSALNGGLQLSVLDGWWAEAYAGDNGWALSGEPDPDEAAQDRRHAAELYRLLEEEIAPAFYERDADGVPRGWLARVRASLRSIVPAFSADRMVRDYAERLYVPVATAAPRVPAAS